MMGADDTILDKQDDDSDSDDDMDMSVDKVVGGHVRKPVLSAA